MSLMEGYCNLSKKELKERGDLHDASKYEPPEIEPYIWLTWYHHCKHCNIDFKYPDGVEKLVKEGCDHHLHCNRHHPESHSDPNEMSVLDIVEMVCDWSAISQELNQGSCINYVKQHISKWSFSNEKLNFIFKTITEFDNRYNNKNHK
ncbi:hypothetical protein DICPUDRAFT_85639 [Dictyostelium purpureum]|uniref:Uncharacterized protein n=1 Tax=Dictyostelium purpureum TaxID=5786 RepID=F1A6D4_DICPU|nr:uncharacterized protein DICPUDRAFT_85639 [Dictyostelium purpureum]EGC28246.1 hypothetical protein DICPUDRAFT_85639 [Dictyostelium purpureum]|eukprot:XP_003295227.1 hypothetical protein DICPUDRAFT_85639 [Dictyostelium purpureum]